MLSIHQNNAISRLPICAALSLHLALAPLSVQAATVTLRSGGDIRAAVSQLHSGDTLLLESGTYADGFGPAIPSGVTIRAIQPRTAIIQSSSNADVINLDNVRDVVLDGLVLDKQQRFSGTGLGWSIGTQRFTFQNGEVRNILGNGTCSPSGAFGGPWQNEDPQLIIRTNFIHDIGDNDPPPDPQTCNFSYGFYLTTNGVVIEGNTWANISAFAIHGYPGPRNNIIRNNTFCNTGPVLVKGSGNTVEGNRLYRVGQTVYPWERGQTLMVDSSNTERNNQVFAEVDGSVCQGGALTPIRQPLPAPWKLRAVLR